MNDKIQYDGFLERGYIIEPDDYIKHHVDGQYSILLV
jgi:hypothetical protein